MNLSNEARTLLKEYRSNRQLIAPHKTPIIVEDNDPVEQPFVSFRSFFDIEDPYTSTLREYVDTGHSYSDDYCAVCSVLTEDEARHGFTPEQVEAKRKKVAGPRIKKMFQTYGNAEAEPAHESVLKKRIGDRFDELSSMSPQQRRKEYSATDTRRKKIGLTSPFRGNEKTDTSATIPTKTAPKGHISLAMAMTPDTARHYTKPDMSAHVDRNTCVGSTAGCRATCLAKHGNYGFAKNKGHMDVSTHSLTHNEASTRDHATHVYQKLEHATSKAAKQGKQVLTRYSVTDDSGANIHSEATAKHFPGVVQTGYTKRHNTPYDPGKGIHTAFSDTGPAVSGGKINDENYKRRSVLHAATVQRGMPAYMVFNRRRPGRSHDENHPVRKEYHDTMSSLHTVRRYELSPSEPKAGETPEHHNPAGHGRVVSQLTGKSHRYQDHPVADKVNDLSGKSIYPSQHDARNADNSTRTMTSPEGKKVGHVVPAFATTSTSHVNLKTAFFHPVENIKNGVYHDAHPDEVEAAKRKAQG